MNEPGFSRSRRACQSETSLARIRLTGSRIVMTPERWRDIERLYHAVLNRPAPERASFLASACGGDPDLRREVESLLAHSDSRSDGFTAGALGKAAQLASHTDLHSRSRGRLPKRSTPPTSRAMAASFTPGTPAAIGTPTALFEAKLIAHPDRGFFAAFEYDVTNDGSRFLVNRMVSPPDASLSIIVDWTPPQ